MTKGPTFLPVKESVHLRPEVVEIRRSEPEVVDMRRSGSRWREWCFKESKCRLDFVGCNRFNESACFEEKIRDKFSTQNKSFKNNIKQQ